MKPKATSSTAEEREHVAFVKALGCLICGAEANGHHVMHAPGKRCRRDDRFVVPLCHRHHQGDHGVHGKHCGSEASFLRLWGVDLVGWCMAAWERRHEPEHPFWTVGVTRLRAIAWPVLCDIEGRSGSAKGRTNALDPT